METCISSVFSTCRLLFSSELSPHPAPPSVRVSQYRRSTTAPHPGQKAKFKWLFQKKGKMKKNVTVKVQNKVKKLCLQTFLVQHPFCRSSNPIPRYFKIKILMLHEHCSGSEVKNQSESDENHPTPSSLPRLRNWESVDGRSDPIRANSSQSHFLSCCCCAPTRSSLIFVSHLSADFCFDLKHWDEEEDVTTLIFVTDLTAFCPHCQQRSWCRWQKSSVWVQNCGYRWVTEHFGNFGASWLTRSISSATSAFLATSNDSAS